MGKTFDVNKHIVDYGKVYDYRSSYIDKVYEWLKSVLEDFGGGENCRLDLFNELYGYAMHKLGSSISSGFIVKGNTSIDLTNGEVYIYFNSEVSICDDRYFKLLSLSDDSIVAVASVVYGYLIKQKSMDDAGLCVLLLDDLWMGEFSVLDNYASQLRFIRDKERIVGEKLSYMLYEFQRAYNNNEIDSRYKMVFIKDRQILNL